VAEEKSEQLKFVDSRRLPVCAALVAAVVFALVFVWLAVRWQIGNMFAEYTPATEPNVVQVAEFAADLAPSDPMSNWFLASSNRDVFSPEKLAASVEKYEKVVRLAPQDFRWWIELGRAREQAEDFSGAENAFLKAVELAPAYTYPRWQIGNFYLRRGATEKAFAELKKAAYSSITYRPQVFSIIWDFYDQDTKILEQITGDSPPLLADLALFYAVRQRPDDSLRIWRLLPPELQKERESTGKVIAQGLFDKRYFRAAAGFAREIGVDAEAQPEKFQNGGFESPIIRENVSYFNWQILPAEKTDVRLDSTQKHEGNRSLRIAFNGFAAQQFYHVYQTVAVEPSAKYRLSFWYRAENLKSAGNPLIEIINANDDRLIVAGKPFDSGSTDGWQKGEIEFTAPPNAEGITVRVGRAFCGNQCPLFGTLWLDDFIISRQ
jgi:tetratricopeptide (TPR) repeat protein